MTEADKQAREAIRVACERYFGGVINTPGRSYAIATKHPGGAIRMSKPPENYEETILGELFTELEQALALRNKANQA